MTSLVAGLAASVLDRVRNVQRHLTRWLGLGRSPAAAVRAYGKLTLSREYLRVGCEDHPAAREYCTWIDEGSKLTERETSSGTLRVSDARLIFSPRSGRDWVVARIWESADKLSEQGHQRQFPFTLFVVVPRPSGASFALKAARLCRQTWQRLDDLYNRVAGLSERSDFSRTVRLTTVEPPADSKVAASLPVVSPAQLGLADWLSSALDGAGSPAALAADLWAQLSVFRNSGGRLPHAWRLPIAPALDCETQLEAWLQWLQANASDKPPPFSAVIRGSASEPPNEITLFVRPILPEDFRSLTKNSDGTSAHLDVQLRSNVLGRREPRPDESDSPDAFASWTRQGTSLRDFANRKLAEPPLHSNSG